MSTFTKYGLQILLILVVIYIVFHVESLQTTIAPVKKVTA